jgi:hypothetical protein
MTTSKLSFVILALASFVVSCKDDQPDAVVKAQLVGSWNSYEIGSQATGFVPGKETLITLMYASGIAFSSDGRFGPRAYAAGKWTESLGGGTYQVKDNQTVILTFFPNTKDEKVLPLHLLKLDQNHLWFEHSFWVNAQNPTPTESHLERAI